jgi:hypothetical protein
MKTNRSYNIRPCLLFHQLRHFLILRAKITEQDNQTNGETDRNRYLTVQSLANEFRHSGVSNHHIPIGMFFPKFGKLESAIGTSIICAKNFAFFQQFSFYIFIAGGARGRGFPIGHLHRSLIYFQFFRRYDATNYVFSGQRRGRGGSISLMYT